MEIIGEQGGGKTITAVKIIRDRLLTHPETTFISNVKIDGLQNSTFYYNSADELMRIILDVVSEDNNKGYLILMDEIHILLNDSDSSLLSKSLFLQFLSQQRKLSINLICTSQLYNKVPKYFRDYVIQQGEIIMCKKFWLIQFNYWLNMAHVKEDDKGYIVYEKANRKIWLHTSEVYKSFDTYATISQIKAIIKKGDDHDVRELD